MSQEIVIHQAVFGYDAGHHLLASSISLPPEAGHALAVATDLSGSPPSEGFERAVTGLPLPGTGFYALFSTWLAPEMPRPGCVWSHVLLIENARLDQISDLCVLQQFFVRPSRQTATTEYDVSLRYEPSANSINDSSATRDVRFAERRNIERVVELLYGSGSPSVALTSSTSEEFEHLLFRIWSQQWRHLREGFRFSTGSFSDRGRVGAQFDIQVIPDANRRWWHGPKVVLLERNDRNGFSSAKGWVNAIVDDLFDPDIAGLRSFFFMNACDVKPSRMAFRKLAETFVAMRDTAPSEWSTVLAGVAQSFPEPVEALTLKRTTITSAAPHDNEASIERAWAALEFLQGEASSGPYSGVQDDVVGLVRAIWPSRRSDIVNLLASRARPSEHPRWSQLAKGVAEAASPQDLAWIWERNPDLVQTLIGLHPTQATQMGVWQLPTGAFPICSG